MNAELRSGRALPVFFMAPPSDHLLLLRPHLIDQVWRLPCLCLGHSRCTLHVHGDSSEPMASLQMTLSLCACFGRQGVRRYQVLRMYGYISLGWTHGVGTKILSLWLISDHSTGAVPAAPYQTQNE